MKTPKLRRYRMYRVTLLSDDGSYNLAMGDDSILADAVELAIDMAGCSRVMGCEELGSVFLPVSQEKLDADRCYRLMNGT